MIVYESNAAFAGASVASFAQFSSVLTALCRSLRIQPLRKTPSSRLRCALFATALWVPVPGA